MSCTLVFVVALMPDPPALVQLYHERLKPGSEAAYSRMEEDVAEVCARMKCPNPYLALKSVAGPKEVWWLNAYASEADRDRVGREYQQDQERLAAMQAALPGKEALVEASENFFATYRSDLSRGCAWRMEGAQFFVIVFEPGGASGAPPGTPRASAGVNPAPPRSGDNVPSRADGCVFEAPGGTRFLVAPAATRAEADRHAAAGGAQAKVLVIRPAWSLPAAAWIAADPDFWRTSPAARTKGGER